MHYSVLVIGEDYEGLLDLHRDRKWDWYLIGGRWRGKLLLKKGNKRQGVLGSPGVFGNLPYFEDGVDQARICDIDWERMKKQGIEEVTTYCDSVALVKLLAGLFGTVDNTSAPFGIFRSDIQRKKYIEDASDFSTYAVLTEDGKWIERGKEEWSKSFFNTFLKDLDPKTLISVVDFHI